VPLKFFSFILLCFALSGCKKEKLSIPFKEITTGTGLNLYSFTKLTDDTIFLCGGKSDAGIILKSTDSGKTWNTLSTFTHPVYSVYFINSQKGFAGCDSSIIFKTEDGGQSWQRFIDYNGVPMLHQVPLRGIYFSDDQTGFVCGGKGFGKGIIYKTSDGGNTWKHTKTDHELRSICNAQNNYGVTVGYGAILCSSDLNNWNLQTNVDGEFYTSVKYSNGKLFSCSYGGCIFQSADANTWKEVYKRISNSQSGNYNCIAVFDNTIVAAGTNGFLSYSTNLGENFESGETFNATKIYDVILLSTHNGLAAGEDGLLFEFSL
jgi:photosystem II stability/assembly factor-like uncharacterized protein